jgi:hypothetical protein
MSAVYVSACHRPSIHHLRPSATVAACHPGPAAPFRGEGVGSPCLRLASLGALRSKLTPRNLPRSAYARLHPRPGETGGAKFLPFHRHPAAARVARDSLCLPGRCLTDSGKNAASQTILPYPSASTGPAAPSRITPLFCLSPATARRAAIA